jgi:hypothetical protein
MTTAELTATSTEGERAPTRVLCLSTGRCVELRAPHVPFAPHYRVLSWPRPSTSRHGSPAATEREIDEMFALAHEIARARGRELFGDPECFAVLFNGARAARMPWPHFHLIPARSPAERRRVLLLLWLKRLSRRLLRAIPTPLRRRLLGA